MNWSEIRIGLKVLFSSNLFPEGSGWCYGTLPVRNAHKENNRAKSEHSFSQGLLFWFFIGNRTITIKGFGLDFAFWLELKLGSDLGLEFGLGLDLGLGLG